MGGAVFVILMVMASGGGIANADADAGGGASDVTGSGSRPSFSMADSAERTSPPETQRSSSTEQTAEDTEDTDSSATRPPADDAATPDPDTATTPHDELDPPEDSSGDVPSPPDSTVDPTPPAQGEEPAATDEDPPSAGGQDDPTTDASPPTQDSGSSPGPEPSPTPEEAATAETTDDSAAGTTVGEDSTMPASLPTPADDLPPAASAPATMEAPVPSAPPAGEPSVVAPVAVTDVPVTVPLVPATAAFAPPGTLQWFVLLAWFQLQWLMQWQQQNGWDAVPALRRFDGRDTPLMSALFDRSMTPEYLATQLPWLRTTLGAARANPLTDLPIDHGFLHQISTTLAAEAASLPAIAEAVSNQVRAHSGFLLNAPCVGSFINKVSLWALLTAAALGLFGMISLTGLGVTVGFRQAKAGFALQACGIARFAGPGPLGVARAAGFVDIRTRRTSEAPPRLRVVVTDLRDSA